MDFVKYLTDNIGQTIFGVASILAIVAGLYTSYLQAAASDKQHKEQLNKSDVVIREQQNLIEEQRNLITGGDSFLFLSPAMGSGKLILSFNYIGRYPMYDVKVDVREFDYMLASPINFYDERSPTVVEYTTVQSFINAKYLLERPFPVGSGHNGKRFIVTIHARNCIVEQEIFVQNGEDVVANKVNVIYTLAAARNREAYGKFRHVLKSVNPNFDQKAFHPNSLRGDTSWGGNYEFDNINNIK